MASEEKASHAPAFLRVLHDSDTPMGRIILRQRWSLALERDVFEMTMDGKLMMSSAVVDSERALAERALALLGKRQLKVLVGGLGFGFTAQTVLKMPQVDELTIIERLELVIDWHRSGVLPWSQELLGDARVKVVRGDFFAFATGTTEANYDGILIDIDDAPNLLWHASHGAFYTAPGLEAVHKRLAPQGVLAMWCATHPGDGFLAMAEAVFATTEVVEIPFENPCLRQPESNFLVLATARKVENGGDGR